MKFYKELFDNQQSNRVFSWFMKSHGLLDYQIEAKTILFEDNNMESGYKGLTKVVLEDFFPDFQIIEKPLHEIGNLKNV